LGGCLRILVLALALAAAGARAQLPVVELGAGIHLIRAEVAGTFESRMRGLMFRRELAANAGMVFVFEEDAQHCMWMKNTLIALAVAFVDRDGVIVSISEKQPHSEQSHCATRPARYALEMNKGWFARRGIRPGATLRGLERLAPR
jgi:hypothetical protein